MLKLYDYLRSERDGNGYRIGLRVPKSSTAIPTEESDLARPDTLTVPETSGHTRDQSDLVSHSIAQPVVVRRAIIVHCRHATIPWSQRLRALIKRAKLIVTPALDCPFGVHQPLQYDRVRGFVSFPAHYRSHQSRELVQGLGIDVNTPSCNKVPSLRVLP